MYNIHMHVFFTFHTRVFYKLLNNIDKIQVLYMHCSHIILKYNIYIYILKYYILAELLNCTLPKFCQIKHIYLLFIVFPFNILLTTSILYFNQICGNLRYIIIFICTQLQLYSQPLQESTMIIEAQRLHFRVEARFGIL